MIQASVTGPIRSIEALDYPSNRDTNPNGFAVVSIDQGREGAINIHLSTPEAARLLVTAAERAERFLVRQAEGLDAAQA